MSLYFSNIKIALTDDYVIIGSIKILKNVIGKINNFFFYNNFRIIDYLKECEIDHLPNVLGYP